MARHKPVSRPTVGSDPHWELVFDSLQEGVITLDASGAIVAMNQSAEQLTGSSIASAVRRHHSEVFRHNRWLSRLIDEATEGGRAGIRAEGEMAGLWGRSVPVRASASPTLDSHGRRVGAAIILQDLSLQAGLEADQQRAQSLSHIGGLVAGLAHEIKNPLSGIRGAVQLLGKEIAGNERSREYIGLVLREVDRLTHLLEQLLQLGSRGTFEGTAVNVHEVIEHVLSLTAGDAARSMIRIHRLFDPSLPMVRGHHDSLIQVLLNLVQNAIQAVSALPENAPRDIRVSTRIETDVHLSAGTRGRRKRTRFLRIDLEDTGPGVPIEIQPNLFSPFLTTKPKGTGLGLAISFRIISDHGGRLRFESEPGRTVFRIILPVWEPPSS